MIEIMQECRSNEGYQPIQVESESAPGKFHTVLTASWLGPFDFICDCKGFEFRHRCSHQRKAAKLICRWAQIEGPEIQNAEMIRNMRCPRCGGPTRRVMEEVDE